MSRTIFRKKGKRSSSLKNYRQNEGRGTSKLIEMLLKMVRSRFFLFMGLGLVFLACSTLLVVQEYHKRIGSKVFQEVVSFLNQLGFTLKDVTVLGRYRTSREAILSVVRAQPHESIFKYNLAQVKDKLEALPWVREATVHRNICGRLSLYLIEREPVAIYYNKDEKKNFLVDQEGVLIDVPIAAELKKLPVLSGDEAFLQGPSLLNEIEKFPRIRSHLTAMAFVQKRRWNLKLDNAVEVRLPDHDLDRAFAVLSILIKEGKTSSGDITKIDLRFDKKVVLTLSETGKAFLFKEKQKV